MDRIKKLFQNQGMRYIFFGGCTTMVNLISYAILRMVFGVDVTVSGFISIILSIIFAYVVNKIFVFESKTETKRELLKEISQFVGMRMGTMFIEVFGVVLLSSVWGIHDMIAKIGIQVVVLVLNYIFSKVFVFADKKDVLYLSTEEKRARQVKKRCILWSIFIPIAAVLAAFIGNGVFPFGDHGVLIIDSLHQYLPFFTDFHDKLESSETLLYSFGGGMGYNFWATFAYYLASPLNFLASLFPAQNMMDFMDYLIVLKIGLTGGAFAWYLSDRNKGKDYSPIAFSVMFALSSFIIGYYFNLMWLDSIAVLPIVMMGIERIVKGESGRTYGIALFVGLYCNYYIGFMLCLFSCLYFVVQWVSAKAGTVKEFFKSCVRFGWYSLLGGGMAALVLVPAYMALGITESMVDNGFPDKIKFYTSTIDQLTSHFALVEPINIADDQSGVNAFCGVIVLILAVLYFLDKEISLKERVAKLLLCAFLILSFNFNMLNFIWHGFHVQNGLPNRFAFIYIAVLLVMGFDAFGNIRRQSYPRLILAGLVPIGFTVYCLITKAGEREWYVYVATLALLGLYLLLLISFKIVKKEQRIPKWRNAIVGVIIVEMVATGIYGVCCNGTVGRSTYLDEQTAYKAMMARTGDTEFFRSEIDSQRMRNETMFLGGNGLVLFSSTMPGATVELCKSIGMEARTNKNGYNGVTKLFNDIFGVRYLVSKADSDTLYNMEKIDYQEPLALYKNEEALSLGFMVSRDVKNWNIEDKVAMEVQDEFVELATGEEGIYALRERYDIEEGPNYIIRLHPGEQTYLELTSNVKELKITTPQYEKTINNYNNNVFDLGIVTEESKANVTIKYKEDSTTPVGVRVYTVQDEEYAKVYEKLSKNQWELTITEDDHLEGTMQVDEAGTMMTSIPYEKGWKVLVDGEEVETYPIGKALLGLDLEEGTHTVTMTYTPDGLWLGTILTFTSILLFLFTVLWESRRRERKEKYEKQTKSEVSAWN